MKTIGDFVKTFFHCSQPRQLDFLIVYFIAFKS